MGTPEFAVPTLNILLNSLEHHVTAVFTQRPKARGRGLQEERSHVHNLALKSNIPVYTPASLKSEEITALITSIEADIIVVVAYGFLIPPAILHAKKYGCLNIHPSSLPRHRGAAPLQYTIIEGDKNSAVAVMQMDEGFDTGDIILQQEFSIKPRITLQVLHDQCAIIGADLLIKVLNNIDNLPKIKQNNNGITYANKLRKEEGRINWADSAYKIDCKIRGMNPWPGVYFTYKEKIIKVLEADYSENDTGLPIGTVMDSSLTVACGKGSLIVKRLQLEGKRPLNTKEFILGFKIPVGAILYS